MSLEILGEIRFGPLYCSLRVDSWHIPSRVFGISYLWSPDSRYLAIQEWYTTDPQLGPYTGITVFDCAASRQCQISRLKKGFIDPLGFEGAKIIYKKTRFSLGGSSSGEYEVDLGTLERWTPMPLFDTL